MGLEITVMAASLEGLAGSLEEEGVLEDGRMDVAWTVFATYGGALRLGVDVPDVVEKYVERWMWERGVDVVREVVRWVGEMTSRLDADMEEGQEEFFVKERDEAESVLYVCRRAGLDVGQLQGAVDRFDDRARLSIYRENVVALLGEVATLHSSYLDRYPRKES